jgi:NAD+ synthase (glutamine-hydrolysing)
VLGPYQVHDFFLYNLIRWGYAPEKVLELAVWAFEGRYSRQDLRQWLTVFLERFFANQFKRSCLPDGPKVGSVALSPRGDWRMPSDALPAVWLAFDGETLPPS